MLKIEYPACIYYVGTAREMLSLYKAFLEREIYDPMFCELPKANMERMYSIIAYKDDDIFPDNNGKMMFQGETNTAYVLAGAIEQLRKGNYI